MTHDDRADALAKALEWSDCPCRASKPVAPATPELDRSMEVYGRRE